MNKRARLSRRVLREHRRGKIYHVSRDRQYSYLAVYDFWSCPHCTHASVLVPSQVPRIYR